MKKAVIILIHALIGFALCGATVGLGMSITTEFNALVIHAIVAPVIFAVLSWVYFRMFGYTTPLVTAVIFLAVVIVLDFFLVAVLILRSFDMFRSFIGTWLPYVLIFLSTWLTGILVRRQA